MPNCITCNKCVFFFQFVIMFLAVIRVRATAAPLNSAYMPEEFEFYLSDSESKLLLIAKEGNEAAEAAAAKLNIPRIKVTLPNSDSDVSLSPSSPLSDCDLVSEIVNDPSDVALFLHTSGTTSRPKGVPLTQHNLVSSVNNIKSVYKLTESDSTVIVLPLFHVHGLIAGKYDQINQLVLVIHPIHFDLSKFLNILLI